MRTGVRTLRSEPVQLRIYPLPRYPEVGRSLAGSVLAGITYPRCNGRSAFRIPGEMGHEAGGLYGRDTCGAGPGADGRNGCCGTGRRAPDEEEYGDGDRRAIGWTTRTVHR